jgi:hypothetical protein
MKIARDLSVRSIREPPSARALAARAIAHVSRPYATVHGWR